MAPRGTIGCPSCLDSFGSIEALTSVSAPPPQLSCRASLIPRFSISGRNISSYAASARLSLHHDIQRTSIQKMKCALHPRSVRWYLIQIRSQHNDGMQTSFSCSECNREFNSEHAKEQVFIRLSSTASRPSPEVSLALRCETPL